MEKLFSNFSQIIQSLSTHPVFMWISLSFFCYYSFRWFRSIHIQPSPSRSSHSISSFLSAFMINHRFISTLYGNCVAPSSVQRGRESEQEEGKWIRKERKSEKSLPMFFFHQVEKCYKLFPSSDSLVSIIMSPIGTEKNVFWWISFPLSFISLLLVSYCFR